MRLVKLAALIGALALCGATVAIASTDVESQNTDLTVAASLHSSGPDAERATVGDTVTASSSLTNNTSGTLKTDVSATIAGPDGTVMYSKMRTVTLPRGKTSTVSNDLSVQASYLPGVYTLTVSASDANGTSTAVATITVY
jgi:uncharacterized protein YfaS (alpha-2-macroglobulin family)